MKLISPCCRAEVRVAWDHLEVRAGTGWYEKANWYECMACGRPCDPVEAEEKKCDREP